MMGGKWYVSLCSGVFFWASSIFSQNLYSKAYTILLTNESCQSLNQDALNSSKVVILGETGKQHPVNLSLYVGSKNKQSLYLSAQSISGEYTLKIDYLGNDLSVSKKGFPNEKIGCDKASSEFELKKCRAAISKQMKDFEIISTYLKYKDPKSNAWPMLLCSQALGSLFQKEIGK